MCGMGGVSHVAGDLVPAYVDVCDGGQATDDETETLCHLFIVSVVE